MIDIFGHVGYLLIALGMFALSKKKIYGWMLRLYGELIWFAIGLEIGMTSIWIWGAIFILIDMWGYYRWVTNEN